MAHLGILNIAVSTGAVRIAGVTTPGVSYFSGYEGFQYEKASEKIGYNNFRNFCSYFGRRPQVLFIVTENKNVFFYIRSNNVFSSI